MELFEYHSGQEQKASFRYVACSETNQRENNEDHFLIYHLSPVVSRSSLHVLSLADGMGGHDHGELVSYEALRKVSQVLFEHLCILPAMNVQTEGQTDQTNQKTIELVVTALKSALEQADAYVKRMVQSNQWHMAGSTIAVAIILDHHAIIANIGDSPIFHYQAYSGRIHQVTKDHSITSGLVRANRLTPQVARYHERRNELEFYVGAGKLPRDLIEVIELEQADLLLLCTDGVTNSTGSLLPDQIERIIAEAQGDLRILAQQLLAEACLAGETDNQTLILWQHDPYLTTEAISHEQHVQTEANEIIEAIEEKIQQQNNHVATNDIHQSANQYAEVNRRDASFKEPGEADSDDQKTESLAAITVTLDKEHSEQKDGTNISHVEEVKESTEGETKEEEEETNIENTKHEEVEDGDKAVEILDPSTEESADEIGQER